MRKPPRVDRHPTLRPTEGNIHQRTLKRHPKGKGRHLVLIHVGMKPNPPLSRTPGVL